MQHASDRLELPSPTPLVSDTALYRAVRRVRDARARFRSDLSAAHLGDWCFCALTVTPALWCLAMTWVVAPRPLRLQIGALAMVLGLVLIVAGPLLRRWEAQLLRRETGPRDTLMIALWGAATLLGGAWLVLPAVI